MTVVNEELLCHNECEENRTILNKVASGREPGVMNLTATSVATPLNDKVDCLEQGTLPLLSQQSPPFLLASVYIAGFMHGCRGD